MLTTKSSDPSRTDWRGTQQLRVFIVVVSIHRRHGDDDAQFDEKLYGEIVGEVAG